MGKSKKPKPIPTDEQIVRQVLEENGFEAEEALIALVETLVNRHVDCELRKYGRRDAWTPGNERTNSLIATMDALHQARATIEGGSMFPQKGAPPPPPLAPEVAERVELLRTVMMMLTHAQFAAERRVNLIDEDGEERPIMRLVTE